MREICTSGSVGALGGNLQGDPACAKKLGRGGDAHDLNLSLEPCGCESRPVELADQQPEASLAWWRATSTARRRQRDQMPCDRAPKSYLWRASVFFVCGGHVGSVDTGSAPAGPVPPGSESKANGRGGSPGTWEILPVLRRPPAWSNRYSKLRDDPTAVRLRPCGDESQTIRGIAKRKK